MRLWTRLYGMRWVWNKPSFHVCLDYRFENNMKMAKISSTESLTDCLTHDFHGQATFRAVVDSLFGTQLPGQSTHKNLNLELFAIEGNCQGQLIHINFDQLDEYWNSSTFRIIGWNIGKIWPMVPFVSKGQICSILMASPQRTISKAPYTLDTHRHTDRQTDTNTNTHTHTEVYHVLMQKDNLKALSCFSFLEERHILIVPLLQNVIRMVTFEGGNITECSYRGFWNDIEGRLSRDLSSSRNIISNPKILGTFRDVSDNKVAICYIICSPLPCPASA